MGLARPPSGAAFKADEHSASLGVGSRHNFLILERTSLLRSVPFFQFFALRFEIRTTVIL